jgi:hypothetical protein
MLSGKNGDGENEHHTTHCSVSGEIQCSVSTLKYTPQELVIAVAYISYSFLFHVSCACACGNDYMTMMTQTQLHFIAF